MLFRRNLLRQGRDKGLRRPDPPDPFRKTGQLLPRLAKSTGNVRFPTIRFLRQKLCTFLDSGDKVSVKVVGYSLRRPSGTVMEDACPDKLSLRAYRVCRNDPMNIPFGEKSDESIFVDFADFRASLAGYLLHRNTSSCFRTKYSRNSSVQLDAAR